MRNQRFSFLLPLVILLLIGAGCRPGIFSDRSEYPLTPGDYTIELRQGTQKRFYLLHVPPTVQWPAPLVLSFHGGAGSAKIQADFYGWKEMSDQEGFVVAFPNGASRLVGGQLATWNVGDCCGYAKEQESDDVGFVRDVIADIRTKADINHVFATGMSNGGMLSYRLACDASDLVDAIAPVAGTDNTETCNPTRAIPIFHIHSRLDNRVPYQGGCGDYCNLGANYTSVPDTIETWVDRNGCSSSPTPILQREAVTCRIYEGCQNGAVIQTCITEDGGHSWPGIQQNPNPLEGRASQALNATDEIWEFFESIRP